MSSSRDMSSSQRLESLTLVAAASRNRVIGKDGQLPWHEPEDLKYFRTVTTGHAIIMGRKTWDALGKPLPKRRNIVVTRRTDLVIPGAEVFTSLSAAITAARNTDPEPQVIGGGELYQLALPLATRVLLTEIQRDVDGDAWFPELGNEWTETSRRESGALAFLVFERRSP